VKPAAWIIQYPDGVTISLIGETCPKAYLPFAKALVFAPSAAASDVLAERQRQQKVEGWTAEHDDQYTEGQLSAAAACYALHTEPVGNVGDYLRFWPWPAKWWKPTDRRRNLVKAAALLIAEIERIDRAVP